MNALVHKRFESPAAMASYAHVLARAADAIPVGAGGLPILKLEQEGKDAGYFFFGEDATPVSDDDLWAVNPFHILRGYICFSQKNEVLGEVLRPITAEPVDYDKLPIHYGRDKRGKEIELEWEAQIVLHMQCIAGPNEGASVVYKPTSGGGLKLCRTILHEIARRLAKGTDKPVPTGYLSASEYKHKGFNKTIWNPLFDPPKTGMWVDMEFADPEGTTSIDDVEEDKIDNEGPRHGREYMKAKSAPEKEDAPRGRSRSRDAEEAEVIEDEPKRGRGRARDNNPKDYDGRREDDDAEEAPKRGRGRPKKEATNDDDEPRRQDAEEGTRKRGEPAPRRGRGRDEDEDDAPRGRERGSRGRDRDEDDDAPRSRSRR